MHTASDLEALNEAQRAAVEAPVDAHVRVLAGAGSGKTRVLVQRIAWLIDPMDISPWSIFAVTFTNKAAAEMRTRVEQTLGYSAGGMWIGTFHGLANRFLRRHAAEANLDRHFQILDSEDQLRTVRRAMSALSLDEKLWNPRSAQAFINARKDEGHRPEHLEDRDDPVKQRLIQIYAEYQRLCESSESVDFAELLLRAHETLRDNSELLDHYHQRFRYFLVDEFQDTNTIQYGWLRLLAGDQGRVFVVGDDDQSIYGWRGARIENILRMEREFPGTITFRLEENYRSTGTILKAANALIANNGDRLGKDLWTAGEDGEPVTVYSAFNERDEARYVVDRIRAWAVSGNARADVAVLYRANAQSRVFEEALIAQQIPYRVYGGLRFFERAEIKDTLAYLRLVANRADDGSFERVVNTPPRGIGGRTIEKLRTLASEAGESLWDSARRAVDGRLLAARAARSVEGFLNLVEVLSVEVQGVALGSTVEAVNQRSGLLDFHSRDTGGRGQERVENLKELVTAARGFEAALSDEDVAQPLSAFLAHAVLEAGEAQADSWEDCVQLMTLHSAKGLEFSLVFLVGMEEGLFPTKRSLEDPGRLEEERRLCYVGMTRAKSHLCLCHAERRRIFGEELLARESRFLREIPATLLSDSRPRAHVSRPQTARPLPRPGYPDISGVRVYNPGTRVTHPHFGEGTVLRYEGNGPHLRVHVNFQDHGSKCLVLAHAKLDAMNRA